MKTSLVKKYFLAGLLALTVAWSGWAQPADESAVATDAAVTNVTAPDPVPTNGVPLEAAAPVANFRRGPVVVFLGTAELKKGETADAVVAILGSAKAHGNVREAVVAIGGDAEAEGEVGDAVVAVGGNARLKGKARDGVVAIAGDAELEGEVGDAVVAVFGDVKIKPGSHVRGDVVTIGGKVEVAKDTTVGGTVVEVGAGQYPILAPLKGVADWFKDCGFKLRILAPKPGWYWVFVGVFFVFYLLLAVAFPRPVAACVTALQERPATTFLLGLLTKLLLPLVIVVLAMIVIGVVVVPFISVAVFIAAAFGKVALMQYLGGKIFRVFGIALARPVGALLVGFVLLTLIYMVPILSLLVYGITGIWALGVAVTAMFGGARKETPSQPGSGPMSGPTPEATTFASAGGVAPMATADFGATPGAGTPGVPPLLSALNQAPPPVGAVPAALGLPRAGFFERMGAAFLDVILVSLLGALVGGPPLGFLVALAYFAGMWAWKGTTIGGIVLNLKVVRLDDQPVTFAVALVRGLAAAFSTIVLFLGFFWIIWDADKQGWHDKIAGTVVVRLPRGMPLVCL